MFLHGANPAVGFVNVKQSNCRLLKFHVKLVTVTVNSTGNNKIFHSVISMVKFKSFLINYC